MTIALAFWLLCLLALVALWADLLVSKPSILHTLRVLSRWLFGRSRPEMLTPYEDRRTRLQDILRKP